jgi:hypothetical protein
MPELQIGLSSVRLDSGMAPGQCQCYIITCGNSHCFTIKCYAAFRPGKKHPLVFWCASIPPGCVAAGAKHQYLKDMTGGNHRKSLGSDVMHESI